MTPRSGRGLWASVLTGLLWAQGCIALEFVALPKYISLCERVAQGLPYRCAAWTLLLPLTLATWIVDSSPAGGAVATTASTRVSLVLCSTIGVTLCWLVGWVLGVPGRRTYALLGLGALYALGAACAVDVALQCREAVLAERVFFAMVARVDAPHRDAATVVAAREFVRRYPDSRWAGEALRITAMAEWDAGRTETASALWRRFADRFRDSRAPGVAYAEYSIALCDERLGRAHEARGHLRAAIDVIRRRGDGIQAWIAEDAANRLSTLERADGRLVLAGFWKAKSRTFADVYSTE